MKKNKMHLTFYKMCMEAGALPIYPETATNIFRGGLCESARRGNIDWTMLGYFCPDKNERDLLEIKGLDFGWWASDLGLCHPDIYFSFGPLRQTIVLFMAAMSGEL